jgi:hypothetical protein
VVVRTTELDEEYTLNTSIEGCVLFVYREKKGRKRLLSIVDRESLRRAIPLIDSLSGLYASHWIRNSCLPPPP